MMQESLLLDYLQDETARINHAYARRDDPDTSHEAAASIPSQALSLQRQRILSLLAIRGAMTDEDIRSAYERSWVAPTEQSLRSRRAELINLGLVAFSGDYGRTDRGNRSRKWVITEVGRSCL